jgi:hypothetical protein
MSLRLRSLHAVAVGSPEETIDEAEPDDNFDFGKLTLREEWNRCDDGAYRAELLELFRRACPAGIRLEVGP